MSENSTLEDRKQALSGRQKRKLEKVKNKQRKLAEKENKQKEKLQAKQKVQQDKAAAKENRQKEKAALKEARKEKRKEFLKKAKKTALITAASLCGLVVVAYLAGVVFFYSHFGFGSVINNANVAFKNTKQVNDIISEQVQGYSLTLIEREDQTETISGQSVNLEYVEDDQVKTLLDAQNPWKWPYRMFTRKRYANIQSQASVKLDETKLAEVLTTLNCTDESQMIAPVDAYPELSGSLYAVHPEVLGTTLDTSAFQEAVKNALLSTAETLDLSESGCYVAPTYTTESQEIIDITNKYNEYLSLTITYQIGDQTEVLDGATTSTWLTWDENYVPTINQEALAAWVADFAQRHSTIGVSRTFTTATGGQAEVSGGTYGWSVDQDQEIALINQMFTDMTSQTREPAWLTTAANHSAVDFGNTFVEVNISTQHMWMVQDGAIVFESDVVTGLPTAARATPAGVYSILEMMRNKTLRGDRREDGTYEYETPVSYWLRVTWTGVGFHDATWQPSFGGNRYTYAGSHGCINMPYSAVQNFYNICFVGCPVIIHY